MLAVVGDTGTGDDAERATARRIAADGAVEAFDALVVVGDLVYEDGDAAKVPAVVTEPFGPVLDQGTVLVPVLGNHDYRSGEQDQILAALGRSRSWYVEQAGELRVVMTVEEQGRAGYGLVAHLAPDKARRLRAALAAALRELGEDPGA